MAIDKRPRLRTDESAGVTVVQFVDKKILDEANIQQIGEEMFALVDQDKRRKIVLDFSNVEYLSSAALGKLITMNKKVKQAKGQLKLCEIRPQIYEVFIITKLNKLFDIHDQVQGAVDSFK
jgi:anti-sigma B factor antagonist